MYRLYEELLVICRISQFLILFVCFVCISMLQTFRNEFLQHIEAISDQVQQYEDECLQKLGRQMIPVERLTENAITNMRRMQKNISAKSVAENDPCFRDCLLVELVRWFKEEFFTWINTMPCKVCGIEKDQPKYTFVDNGVRVEAFECCSKLTKFYRYNDIVQLLQTRKGERIIGERSFLKIINCFSFEGRCGEFANCFTFLCRCLGYDARFVLATFDHVWTEVYSINRNKWIHVDPSDNVVDAPLIYEYGWKRTIDYIIAYSRDDVQDVTWRYSSHHEMVDIRGECVIKYR